MGQKKISMKTNNLMLCGIMQSIVVLIGLAVSSPRAASARTDEATPFQTRLRQDQAAKELPARADQEVIVANVRRWLGDVLEGVPEVEGYLVDKAKESNSCPLVFESQEIVKIDFGLVSVRLPKIANPVAEKRDRKLVAEIVKRRVEALADAHTGMVLRVVISDPSSKEEVPEEPPASNAREQFKNAGPEIWYGAAVPSQISCYDALSAAERRFPINPVLDVPRIVIHLISATFHSEEKVNLWSVDLRGGPNDMGAPPGIPRSAVNHLRHLINADTGKWLIAGTTPQPLAKADGQEEKR